MSPLAYLGAIALAIYVWSYLLLGLTYLAREAKLTLPIRAPLVLWSPHRLAPLLACGQCTSAWTGATAFALLWPIVHLAIGLPWWSWCLLPLAAPAGIGVFDRLARSSISLSVDRLTKALLQGPSETQPSGEVSDD